MRAAFDHLAWDFDVGLARVVARVLRTAAWIFRDAAGLRRVGLMLRREPVGGPFPGVADHVVNAVAVRRERRHRRGALEAVFVVVLMREITLPGIGHMLAT